jgi:hypothetical protein
MTDGSYADDSIRPEHEAKPMTTRIQTHHLRGRLIWLAVAILGVTISLSFAQQLTQTGHALDRNLMVGSNGYNHSRGRGGGGYYSADFYTVGSSARSLYTVNRTGNMVYNQNNAFSPRSRYSPTGYTGDYSSNAWHRRFRYGNGAGGW